MYFPEDAPRPAGHVFILPHTQVHSSDKKDRGYVLLNRCTPPANATLAYRSRQITETARYHAPSLRIGGNTSVAPATRGYAGRKMPQEAASYVYPGRLLFWNSTRLVRSDSTIPVTKSLRDVLATSLGLGGEASWPRGWRLPGKAVADQRRHVQRTGFQVGNRIDRGIVLG